MIKNNIKNNKNSLNSIKMNIDNTTPFSNNYSLNKKLFDPTINSPPNDFMNKLQLRMSVYCTNNTCNCETA